MLVAAALAIALFQQEEPFVRTPAIYRCPAKEAEDKFFEPLLSDTAWDGVCVEPKPGAKAATVIKQLKLKQFTAAQIDTPANLKWRNATIDFVNGKISPKDWLAKTKGLGETIHFLSNPKTKPLRDDAHGDGSSRNAVFAELFMLSVPGGICLTADDTGQTRYLPDPGRYQSWLLAMRDLLGPMLYIRSEHPNMVTGKMEVIRADAKPGILQFRYKRGKVTLNFYFNNSEDLLPAPNINVDNVTGICRAMDLEAEKPRLGAKAVVLEIDEPD